MSKVLLLASVMIALPGVVGCEVDRGQADPPPIAAPGRAQVEAPGRAVRELMQLNQRYDEAWVAADVAAIERLTVKDFTSVGSDGRLRTRAEALAPLRSGDLNIESARSDDVNVRLYGNTAIITGRWTGNGQYKGESWTANERYTSALIRQDGTWRYVADHASEIESDNP